MNTIQDLKQKKLAICCLARDCEKFLRKNIRTLETLASYFDHTQFFIVENDSKDNTRKVLEQWQNRSKYSIHLPDVYEYLARRPHLQINFDRSNDANSFVGVYAARVTRISLARDCYLDYIQEIDFKPDYILMCDIDAFRFSLKGIMDSFLAPIEWDVITANGQIYYFSKLLCQTLYYDSFAVELLGEKGPPQNIKIHLQKEVTELLKDTHYLQVWSAFAGIGIYSYDAVFFDEGVRYLSSIELDSFQYCEHVSFHRSIRAHGYDKIYINANMELYYNTKIRAFVKYILQKIKKR